MSSASEEGSTVNCASPGEFRAKTIDSNRPAFELWQRACRLLEDQVDTSRGHDSKSDFATDLLFLQAYKSFCSIYVLAVRGHEEDAFTILRRLLEIGVQLEYIQRGPPTEQEERASRYLAQDPDLGQHFWWGTSFKRLFEELGLEKTFESDYRFLSQIGHAAARRVLPAVKDARLQIRSTEFFGPLLVFATSYTIGAAKTWNNRFHLISDDDLDRLAKESTGYRERMLANRTPDA